MTWGLLGGPKHGEQGEGDPPEGYEFVAAGRDLPPYYDFELRQLDAVYRWHEDMAYIRDGQTILRNFENGEYAVPKEFAEFAAIAGFGMDAMRVSMGFIADQPTSDDAQAARDVIDSWRENGLV